MRAISLPMHPSAVVTHVFLAASVAGLLCIGGCKRPPSPPPPRTAAQETLKLESNWSQAAYARNLDQCLPLPESALGALTRSTAAGKRL